MALARQDVERDFYTEDEYFEFERTSFGRWEYVRGEIRLMAGGTADHSTVAMNTGATLRAALLPRGCRVFGSDMKVHAGDDTNTFPDVAIVCGSIGFHRGRTDIITNPLLIVEVLSPSTEGYDRTEKFDHYQTIPALQDYLLVETERARILLYTRQNDHWELREATGLGNSVHLPSVSVTLALADVYALIEFDAN